MVTVEVRNDLRRIVQARGRFNRAMTPKEVRIIRRWAGESTAMKFLYVFGSKLIK
jgi:hypothetical protein